MLPCYAGITSSGSEVVLLHSIANDKRQITIGSNGKLIVAGIINYKLNKVAAVRIGKQQQIHSRSNSRSTTKAPADPQQEQ